MIRSLTKLYIAIGLYFSSMVFGTLGYHFIENYPWVDAGYMTMMTLSTVGFGEVHKLSDIGKVFTSFYILYNLCILAFVISVISKYLFEGELKEILNHHMSSREIKKLKNHIIVCGFGRNGQRACEELRKFGKQFVVISIKEEMIKSYPPEILPYYIIGDATKEDVLRMANIDEAEALITCVPDDSINVFVTLTAREMKKDLYIISRANLDTTVSKLHTAGANKVVLPDAIGGRYMADLVTKPQITEFLDTISGTEGDLKLVKININDFKSEFKNKSILELRTRAHSGVNILGYKEGDQDYVFNPSADIPLHENGVLMVLGKTDQIERFKMKYINN